MRPPDRLPAYPCTLLETRPLGLQCLLGYLRSKSQNLRIIILSVCAALGANRGARLSRVQLIDDFAPLSSLQAMARVNRLTGKPIDVVPGHLTRELARRASGADRDDGKGECHEPAG